MHHGRRSPGTGSGDDGVHWHQTSRGSVLALTARDVDDGGTLLHVYGTKTGAAKRPILVDPAFQPYLLEAAHGKAPGDLLFPGTPRRKRQARDPGKARKDALLRRVIQLCKVAGVPRVVSHSMRGLNATLRLTGGATDESITRALGHLDICTTKRHYFAPGLMEQVDARRAHGRLLADQISLTEIRELSLQGKVPGVSGA